MALLKKLGGGQGYLKAGLLGFNKSGKSWTAALLACGTWKYFGKKGRIAIYDTETGAEYLVPMIRKEYGDEPLGISSRSFDDLMAVTRELQENDIFLADSITHPWRELCDSYLEQVNEARSKKKLPRRNRLEFQDWNPIKAKWAEWTDWYLNSKVHVIICGRAGFEYENEVNEETGKRELQKTGIKMKTESEFGFEPSLLIEMERVHPAGDLVTFVRRATVIGDRFNKIDGAVCDNPTFEFFKPHMDMLTPGAHTPVITQHRTDLQVDEAGDVEYQRTRREREILCEEITGVLTDAYPSQTGADKQSRQRLLHDAFTTYSWTKIQGMDPARLREGLANIRAAVSGTTSSPVLNDWEQLWANWKWSNLLASVAQGAALKYGMTAADMRAIPKLATLTEDEAIDFLGAFGQTRSAVRILDWNYGRNISERVADLGNALPKPWAECTEVEIGEAMSALDASKQAAELFVVEKG
jgi:hypothetical protein